MIQGVPDVSMYLRRSVPIGETGIVLEFWKHTFLDGGQGQGAKGGQGVITTKLYWSDVF